MQECWYRLEKVSKCNDYANERQEFLQQKTGDTEKKQNEDAKIDWDEIMKSSETVYYDM